MASSNNVDQEEIWVKEQRELKKGLKVEDDIDLSTLRFVGGVDISFQKGDDVHVCPGLVVLLYSPGHEDHLQVVYQDFSLEHVQFPYIANFLAFREAPLLEFKINKLKEEHPEFMPQFIMVDGNGVHHKRGFGIASHLGVRTGLPTIGVAKNLLIIDEAFDKVAHKNQIKDELQKIGDQFPLKRTSGETTAMTLRTSKPVRNSPCKPIYVSVGHRIGLETAVDLVLKCCDYKVPEPTRQADILSREYLRDHYEEELARCSCRNGQS